MLQSTMRLRPVLSPLSRLLVSVASAAVILLCVTWWPSAQGPCVNPPRHASIVGWKARTVCYDLSGLPDYARSQAEQAFTAWNGTNLGVTFVKAQDETQRTAATDSGVTFVTGTVPTEYCRAGYVCPAYANTSVNKYSLEVTKAVITVDLDDSRFFDRSRILSFQTAVLKIVLHEIGHTFGLANVEGNPCTEQTSGGSVMNSQCNVNDIGPVGMDGKPTFTDGIMATTVTSCDRTRARVYIPPTSPVPGTGGGSGGSGGGGGGGSGGSGGCPDADQDGWCSWEDCDDTDGVVHPYTFEDELCWNYEFIGVLDNDIDCDGISEYNRCVVITVYIRAHVSEFYTYGDPAPATESMSEISLQTTVTGQFVIAEGGGQGPVNANSDYIGPWSRFWLVDLNGGDLMDGDQAAFIANEGWFLQAECEGSLAMRATGERLGALETFTVRLLSGADSRVDNSEEIALQSACGYYVVAEGGGGGAVNVNRTDIGPWERFRFVDHSHQSPPPPPPPPPPPEGVGLQPDQSLHAGDSLTSQDGRFVLVYQGDGNLVLYQGSEPLWASNTCGTTTDLAIMQGDGNFVVYDGYGSPIWHAGTHGQPGAYLRLLDNGSFVIYSTGGDVLRVYGPGDR